MRKITEEQDIIPHPDKTADNSNANNISLAKDIAGLILNPLADKAEKALPGLPGIYVGQHVKGVCYALDLFVRLDDYAEDPHRNLKAVSHVVLNAFIEECVPRLLTRYLPKFVPVYGAVDLLLTFAPYTKPIADGMEQYAFSRIEMYNSLSEHERIYCDFEELALDHLMMSSLLKVFYKVAEKKEMMENELLNSAVDKFFSTNQHSIESQLKLNKLQASGLNIGLFPLFETYHPALLAPDFIQKYPTLLTANQLVTLPLSISDFTKPWVPGQIFDIGLPPEGFKEIITLTQGDLLPLDKKKLITFPDSLNIKHEFSLPIPKLDRSIYVEKFLNDKNLSIFVTAGSVIVKFNPSNPIGWAAAAVMVGYKLYFQERKKKREKKLNKEIEGDFKFIEKKINQIENEIYQASEIADETNRRDAFLNIKFEVQGLEKHLEIKRHEFREKHHKGLSDKAYEHAKDDLRLYRKTMIPILHEYLDVCIPDSKTLLTIISHEKDLNKLNLLKAECLNRLYLDGENAQNAYDATDIDKAVTICQDLRKQVFSLSELAKFSEQEQLFINNYLIGISQIETNCQQFYVIEASEAYNLKDYPIALAICEKGLSYDENNTKLLILRGDLKLETDAEGAKVDYLRALTKDKNSLPAIFGLTQAHIKLGDYNEAYKSALLGQSKCTIEDNNPDEELQQKQKYTNLFLFLRGVSSFGQENYGEAKDSFAIFLLDDPQNIQALYFYAQTLEHTKDIPGAIIQYQKIIALDASHVLAIRGLAAELLKTPIPDLEQAISLLENFKTSFPEHPAVDDVSKDLTRYQVEWKLQLWKPCMDLLNYILEDQCERGELPGVLYYTFKTLSWIHQFDSQLLPILLNQSLFSDGFEQECWQAKLDKLCIQKFNPDSAEEVAKLILPIAKISLQIFKEFKEGGLPFHDEITAVLEFSQTALLVNDVFQCNLQSLNSVVILLKPGLMAVYDNLMHSQKIMDNYTIDEKTKLPAEITVHFTPETFSEVMTREVVSTLIDMTSIVTLPYGMIQVFTFSYHVARIGYDVASGNTKQKTEVGLLNNARVYFLLGYPDKAMSRYNLLSDDKSLNEKKLLSSIHGHGLTADSKRYEVEFNLNDDLELPLIAVNQVMKRLLSSKEKTTKDYNYCFSVLIRAARRINQASIQELKHRPEAIEISRVAGAVMAHHLYFNTAYLSQCNYSQQLINLQNNATLFDSFKQQVNKTLCSAAWYLPILKSVIPYIPFAPEWVSFDQVNPLILHNALLQCEVLSKKALACMQGDTEYGFANRLLLLISLRKEKQTRLQDLSFEIILVNILGFLTTQRNPIVFSDSTYKKVYEVNSLADIVDKLILVTRQSGNYELIKIAELILTKTTFVERNNAVTIMLFNISQTMSLLPDLTKKYKNIIQEIGHNPMVISHSSSQVDLYGRVCDFLVRRDAHDLRTAIPAALLNEFTESYQNNTLYPKYLSDKEQTTSLVEVYLTSVMLFRFAYKNYFERNIPYDYVIDAVLQRGYVIPFEQLFLNHCAEKGINQEQANHLLNLYSMAYESWTPIERFNFVMKIHHLPQLNVNYAGDIYRKFQKSVTEIMRIGLAETKGQSLHSAISNPNLSEDQAIITAKQFLSEGANPNFGGSNFLMYLAIQKGWTRLVILLCQYGCDLEKTGNGIVVTPLLWAAILFDRNQSNGNYLEIAKILFEYGANSNYYFVPSFNLFFYNLNLSYYMNKYTWSILGGRVSNWELRTQLPGIATPLASNQLFLSLEEQEQRNNLLAEQDENYSAGKMKLITEVYCGYEEVYKFEGQAQIWKNDLAFLLDDIKEEDKTSIIFLYVDERWNTLWIPAKNLKSRPHYFYCTAGTRDVIQAILEDVILIQPDSPLSQSDTGVWVIEKLRESSLPTQPKFNRFLKNDLLRKREQHLAKYIDLIQLREYEKNYENLQSIHFAASNGDQQRLQIILNYTSTSVEQKAGGGWQPMHHAAAFHHPHIIEILINNRAAVDPVTVGHDSERTPLQMAIVRVNEHSQDAQYKRRVQEVFCALLFNGANPNQEDSKKNNAIKLAQLKGHWVSTLFNQILDELVNNQKRLLDIADRPKLNDNDIKFLTYLEKFPKFPLRAAGAFNCQAIHKAAWNGNLELFQWLVSLDKNIISQTADGVYLPLHHAAENLQEEILVYLCQCKELGSSYWLSKNAEGNTALHLALVKIANNKKFDLGLLIIKLFADTDGFNIKNNKGYTPVQAFFYESLQQNDNNWKGIAKLILLVATITQINLFIKDNNDKTILDAINAEKSKFSDEEQSEVKGQALKDLSFYLEKISEQSAIFLYKSQEETHAGAVSYFDEKETSLNIYLRDPIFNCMPIHRAAWSGNTILVTKLLKKDKQLFFIKAGGGFTPIHHACKNAQFTTIKAIIESFIMQGGNPKYLLGLCTDKSEGSKIPLQYVSKDEEIYLLLLKYSPPFKLTDADFVNQFIEQLIQNESFDVLALILQKSKLLIEKDKVKLDVIAQKLAQLNMESILSKKAKLQLFFSALIQLKSQQILKANLIAQFEANINKYSVLAELFREKTMENENLTRMIQLGDINQLAQLGWNSINCQITSTVGCTPFHIAAWYGHLGLLEQLLECNYQLIDETAGGGWLAIHHASANHQADALEFLIKKGANVYAPVNDYLNDHKSTPLHLAIRRYGPSSSLDAFKATLRCLRKNRVSLKLTEDFSKLAESKGILTIIDDVALEFTKPKINQLINQPGLTPDPAPSNQDPNKADEVIPESVISKVNYCQSAFFAKGYQANQSDSLKPTNQSPPKKDDKYSFFKCNRVSHHEEGTWAQDMGIEKALIHYFGDTVHIIQPSLSSVHNPFNSDKGACEYAKVIAGYYDNDNIFRDTGFIQEDGGELKKPVVMVINTDTARAQSETDVDAIGGMHWVTCIILPKKYTVLESTFEYPCERVFFIDSLNARSFPMRLKAVLSDGMNYSGQREPSKKELEDNPLQPLINYQHQVPKAFPVAEFYDTYCGAQQLGGSDCGWWALYNSLMTVITGGNEFMEQFANKQKERADALRSLFPGLDIIENLSQNYLPNQDVSTLETLAPVLKNPILGYTCSR